MHLDRVHIRLVRWGRRKKLHIYSSLLWAQMKKRRLPEVQALNLGG